jgi:DNA repair protein RadC
LRARLASSSVEEFWALALDVRHRLQAEMCLARGSLTGVEVHPRDVFRPLIRSAAAAVIFCHNHPSGDPTPSRQDLELTARLREVGDLCGIAVLDHVVVGWEGFSSLAERNWR